MSANTAAKLFGTVLQNKYRNFRKVALAMPRQHPKVALSQWCNPCHELTAAFMVADRLPVSRKFTAGLIRFLSILSLYCSSRGEI